MKMIKILVLLALFLLALALGSQNQALVTFNYLFAQGEFHLSTLLGSVFVAGFLIAWIIFGSFYLKSQLEIRKLTRKLKQHTKSQEQTNAKATLE
ncbi:LapA family protein [Vibrio sp.]|uniref:LapA family protein n=1 Tax=Vibrio sp. TaxID=678 RepID=UPI003D1487ED